MPRLFDDVNPYACIEFCEEATPRFCEIRLHTKDGRGRARSADSSAARR
jgi:hypothetical protein